MQSHVIYAALMQSLDHPLVQAGDGARFAAAPRFARRSPIARPASPGVTAAHRARLAYSAYTGFLQLSLQLGLPRLGHDEFEAYVDHVIATLVPA